MAESSFKVIIIGGGPSGLTAAHALHRAGISFAVLEGRDDPFVDQGATLALWAPTLRVLHQLDLLDELQEMGDEITSAKSFTKDGELIKSTSAIQTSHLNHGSGPVTFHRAHLVKLLYERLPDEAKASYFTGKKMTHIQVKPDAVMVFCADGTSYQGDIVVGADGVHSNTRRIMRTLALEHNSEATWDAEPPFPATYRCAWASFPRPSDRHVMCDTEDDGRAVNYFVGCDHGWVFLYEKLPKPTAERANYTAGDAEAMFSTFADWPITESLKVKDVFAERTSGGIANLEEGILRHWFWDRIVLVADACHKYAPNAGLGLGSGIQDIVALCNGLRSAVQDAPSGKPTAAALKTTFQKYQDHQTVAIKIDAWSSAVLVRLQTWAGGFYKFFARWVAPFEFVERLRINYIAAPATKQALVLDYVFKNEAIQGRVP